MTDRTPWDTPDQAPAWDREDPRAHDRKRPDGEGYHATILIGSAQGEIAVRLDDVMDVLERAAKYRRFQAKGEEHPNTLKGLIAGQLLSNQPFRLHESGWCKVGFVLDPFAGPFPLAVWWHMDDDRVKVAAPAPEPPLPEPYVPVPLRMANEHDEYRYQHPVIALPGYIYTFEGVDYDADEAMEKARELGSDEGWSWRKA